NINLYALKIPPRVRRESRSPACRLTVLHHALDRRLFPCSRAGLDPEASREWRPGADSSRARVRATRGLARRKDARHGLQQRLESIRGARRREPRRDLADARFPRDAAERAAPRPAGLFARRPNARPP